MRAYPSGRAAELQQLPLAEPAALSDSHPRGKVATSAEAFARIDGATRRNQQARILDLITYRGTDGATSHEVCDSLRLTQQTVSARLNDLLRAGLATRDGRRRKNAAGFSAAVWVATANRGQR